MLSFETKIQGLKINLNKIIGDERGYLCEIAPGGTSNELIAGKIGNIYLATGNKKGIARGGHYHYHLVENFYTLSGLALWLFKDFRKDSQSFNKTEAIILGEKDKAKKFEKIDINKYFLPEAMAQILVPAGVYHIFYPLSDSKVEVLAITNLPHDDNDYVRIAPENDKDLAALIKKYLPK